MTCSQCGSALDSRSTFCSTCGATVPDRYVGIEIAGRYVADRRIAIGGFGSIYRGRELISGRPIALKIMHRELAGDGNLVARFRREGTVLRKLLDVHAVATYELGETDDGLPFIAMELLEGVTLLAMFRREGPLPWRRALAIAKGICSALNEAHRLGIVHRDLKPANIFLTENDHVKVLDFGIAKILSNSDVSDPRELTIMGTAVGTLEYMAPEQLMGGKADPRTDLYTLGVVMYEVITGRRPFNAAGLDLLTEQLTMQPPPPSTINASVPPAVDAILLRCLAQDVDDRFASAADLERAIDETIVAHPPAAMSPSSYVPIAAHPHAMPYAPPPRPPATLPIERPVMTRAAPSSAGPSGRVIALAAAAVIAVSVGIALVLAYA
jgi:eukaryotic-like serine/threonine-protein kinase